MAAEIKTAGNPAETPNTEITFSYPDLSGMEPLFITNSRNQALRLIQDGFIPCLLPQMFLSETGLYGLHSTDVVQKRTPVEAEHLLAKDEENARTSFRAQKTLLA